MHHFTIQQHPGELKKELGVFEETVHTGLDDEDMFNWLSYNSGKEKMHRILHVRCYAGPKASLAW